MKRTVICGIVGTLALVFIIFGCAGTQKMKMEQAKPEKIKIEKLDDLPRHTYTIEIKAADLLEDDKALMKLAAEVKHDLESDLKTYDIQDKTTLKDFYGGLSTIAMLEGRYDDYLSYYKKIIALEDKEAARLTRGLYTRSYIQAKKAGAEDLIQAIVDNLTARVNELPYEIVESEIKESKGQAEIISKNLLGGIVESKIQPMLDQSGSEMSKDIAQQLVGFGYMIRHYLPYKQAIIDVYSAYIDANAVEKADIWAQREVELEIGMDAQPVVAAIWDAGTDNDVFEGLLFTNSDEIPDNGLDDDGNGFVDDVHGIAYTLHAEKTAEMLYPIGDVSADRPRLQRLMKGLTDLTSSIDSEEAAELKKLLGSLEQSEVKPFIEDVSKYGNHCHGTHVAGIVARGNPFVRLLAARLTFDHHLIPVKPTVEQAFRDSIMMIETVDYFKKYGVKVVNMSWGNSMDEIESALEANSTGETAEERKALTRQIFETIKGGLYQAIESAPEILFITSAGNADNDVNFEEFIPSSFDLPNIMSIGAVDQAGDETSFTSFGKVDVYANGYEVLSYVPGGDEMKLSGTSMSSPNVTNLAAKLFALRPELNPAQVRELIEKGCDEKMAGERAIRLINSKNSMMLLANMR